MAEALRSATWEAGATYQHLVVRNDAYDPASPLVHVYIGGDGRPWLTDRIVALDPTPTRELMLNLLLDDPAPAIFVGRPCMFGSASTDPACSPYDWTAGRYSSAAIESMAAVIERFARNEIVLLGHSGGGVFAVALANRLSGVQAVITIASNLDVGEWVHQHHYGPLPGSIDARDEFPLPRPIAQLHLFGADDKNCPLSMALGALSHDPNATWFVLDGMGHECCWATIWPDVMQASLKSGPLDENVGRVLNGKGIEFRRRAVIESQTSR